MENTENPEQISLAKIGSQPTEVGQGAHDGNRGDQLYGVRSRNETSAGFVLPVSSPEVAHPEEGIGLLADRCRIRPSDPIYGYVRRPDA